MIFISYIVFCLVAATLGYGFTFAYLQKEFDCISKSMVKEDRGMSWRMALFIFVFPFLLLLTLSMNDWGKHGLKYRS